MKQYKILSQKDKWFSGKFDPEALEKALNSYAQQGWRVVSCATATMPGVLGGNREEMIIVLEREDPRQGQEEERQRRLREAAAKTFESPAAAPKKPATSGGSEPDIYSL